MKKIIATTIVGAIALLVLSYPVLAQDNEGNTSDEGLGSLPERQAIITTIESIKKGINLFDETLETFVGNTPDVTQDQVLLEGGKTISGAQTFRNALLGISVPLLAILIAVQGVRFITAEERSPASIREFITRVVVTGFLIGATPLLLSTSIRINNLFVDAITGEERFTQFLMDYFDDLQSQAEGTDTDILDLFGGEQGKNMVAGLGFIQTLPLTLPLLFLFLFFLFIGFQFIIRFVSMYFLSVIYPVVVPFAISRGTQNVVVAYFKAWFTFLLHQPFFVLAYVLIMNIVKGMLSEGASLDTLLVYVGFLVFLAGINVLVARLFGDAWTALSTNIQAATATALTYQQTVGRAKAGSESFKRGLFGGPVDGAVGALGRTVGSTLGLTPKSSRGAVAQGGIAKGMSKAGGVGSAAGVVEKGKGTKAKAAIGSLDPSSKYVRKELKDPTKSFFARELKKGGIDVRPLNSKMGVLAASGEAYGYYDKEHSLTGLYKSKQDAINDGINKKDIRDVKLDNFNFIDTSNRAAVSRNNTAVTSIAKEQGKPSNYTHLSSKANTDPKRVKNFLDIGKERNKTFNIQGIAVKRYGNVGGKRSKEQVLRIYTDQNILGGEK